MANPITTAAFDWATRADRGLAEAERAELEAWLSQDERHLGAYHRARATFAFASRAQALPLANATFVSAPLEYGTEDEEESPGTPQSAWTRPMQRRAALALGGVAAAGLAGFSWLRNPAPLPADVRVLRTAVGEVRNVLLEDGTAIVLDTATELRVSLDGNTRSIVLIAGKAIFDVAFDPTRSLFLHALGFAARTSRASFAVESFSQTLPQLVVRAGTLELTPTAATSVALGPNQRAIVAPGGYVTLERMSDAEIDRELFWRQGKIAFAETRLDRAVKDFARYGGPTIELQDPEIRGIQVTGVFSAHDPEGFARAVAKAFELNLAFRNGRVILNSKPVKLGMPQLGNEA